MGKPHDVTRGRPSVPCGMGPSGSRLQLHSALPFSLRLGNIETLPARGAGVVRVLGPQG